jgi:hypothetical protein
LATLRLLIDQVLCSIPSNYQAGNVDNTHFF